MKYIVCIISGSTISMIMGLIAAYHLSHITGMLDIIIGSIFIILTILSFKYFGDKAGYIMTPKHFPPDTNAGYDLEEQISRNAIYNKQIPSQENLKYTKLNHREINKLISWAQDCRGY